MFRIWFACKSGQFVIQFYRYSLLWFNVRDGEGNVRRFDTYDAARGWVESVGLTKSFSEQNTAGHPFAYGTGSWR